MKAIQYEQYGPPEVLHMTDVNKPTPQNNEVLIKIHATSVNYGDQIARDFQQVSPSEFNMPFLFWLMTRFYFGLNQPKINILGSEFAGEIVETGPEVQNFQVGDQVFGYMGQQMGAYAEYLSMAEDGVLALKPENMSFAEAAVVPSGGMTALSILGKQDIQPGDKVLIIGASGGIGSVAVQIAKDAGAEVTGVCGTNRVAYVHSLGADKVIDYQKEDFRQNGESYDLIFDVLGKGSFSSLNGSLEDDGRYVLASFKVRQLLQSVWTKFFGKQKVICTLSPQSRDDLLALKGLIEAGKVRVIIDKSFPFAETAAAHRYAESGEKQGSVVISLA